MSKKEFKKQIKEMVKDIAVSKECDRLFNSGAINIDLIKENDYSYSKIILKVALENVANKIRIYSNEIKKEYNNLKRFQNAK